MLMVVAAALLSCNSGPKMDVTVINRADIERKAESVELPLSAIKAKLGEDLSSVVVLEDGKQIPSQLVDGALLFQASLAPKAERVYQVAIASAKEFPTKAFGRLVPERMDDWAWENDRIAFRVYGPALEATGEISNGIDVWAKRVSELVINKWYTEGFNYHEDTGEGLDCYKVGRTLGAGAMAPVAGVHFALGHNFIEAKLLEQGAIRTSFELNYAPYMVDGVAVTERRVITLDAGSSFNHITSTFSGDFDHMKVAAGIIICDYEGISTNAQWVSHSYSDGVNGTLHQAVILAEGTMDYAEEIDKHIAASTHAKSGEEITYLQGAGWNKFGYPDIEDWVKEIELQTIKMNSPLELKY